MPVRIQNKTYLVVEGAEAANVTRHLIGKSIVSFRNHLVSLGNLRRGIHNF